MNRYFPFLLLFLLLTASKAFGQPDNVDWKFLEKWIAGQQNHTSLQAEFNHSRSLPTMRAAQVKSGRMWFQTPSQLHWELGDPPEMIVLGSKEQAVTIYPRRKRAEVLTLDGSGPAKRGSGAEHLMMMGFPIASDLADFRRQFDVQRLETGDETAEMTLLLRDAEGRKAVRHIDIAIDRATGVVTMFELQFRDGARMRTDFRQVRLNNKIDPSVFVYDLEGFRVERR